MWTSETELLNSGRVVKHSLFRGSSRATFADVISHWRSDAAFRGWFNQLLAGSSFEAFRWETPSLEISNANRPFEFVVYDSPELLTKPNANAFAEHFRTQDDNAVVQFSNLGGDAILIVPGPRAAHSAYGHLAPFTREAPPVQQQLLWEAIGNATNARLSVKPVWLSTAGAGVAWLHVRLDDRPKYYVHTDYRAAP